MWRQVLPAAAMRLQAHPACGKFCGLFRSWRVTEGIYRPIHRAETLFPTLKSFPLNKLKTHLHPLLGTPTGVAKDLSTGGFAQIALFLLSRILSMTVRLGAAAVLCWIVCAGACVAQVGSQTVSPDTWPCRPLPGEVSPSGWRLTCSGRRRSGCGVLGGCSGCFL